MIVVVRTFFFFFVFPFTSIADCNPFRPLGTKREDVVSCNQGKAYWLKKAVMPLFTVPSYFIKFGFCARDFVGKRRKVERDGEAEWPLGRGGVRDKQVRIFTCEKQTRRDKVRLSFVVRGGETERPSDPDEQRRGWRGRRNLCERFV